MKKDPLVFIRHMLDCIEAIASYTSEKSEDDFLDSKLLQDVKATLSK